MFISPTKESKVSLQVVQSIQLPNQCGTKFLQYSIYKCGNITKKKPQNTQRPGSSQLSNMAATQCQAVLKRLLFIFLFSVFMAFVGIFDVSSLGVRYLDT